MRVGMVKVKGRGYQTAAIKFVSEPYAKIMEKIGFRRATDEEISAGRGVASAPPKPLAGEAGQTDIAALRAEYEHAVGKKPFMGWDAARLLEKIAEAKASAG